MKIAEKIVKTIIYILFMIMTVKAAIWSISGLLKEPPKIEAFLILTIYIFFLLGSMRLSDHIIETKI